MPIKRSFRRHKRTKRKQGTNRKQGTKRHKQGTKRHKRGGGLPPASDTSTTLLKFIFDNKPYTVRFIQKLKINTAWNIDPSIINDTGDTVNIVQLDMIDWPILLQNIKTSNLFPTLDSKIDLNKSENSKYRYFPVFKNRNIKLTKPGIVLDEKIVIPSPTPSDYSELEKKFFNNFYIGLPKAQEINEGKFMYNGEVYDLGSENEGPTGGSKPRSRHSTKRKIRGGMGNEWFISEKLPINYHDDNEELTLEYLLDVIQNGPGESLYYNNYKQRCIVGYDTKYYDGDSFASYVDQNIGLNENPDMTIYLTVAKDKKTILKNLKYNKSNLDPIPLTETDLTKYVFYIQSVPCQKKN